MKIIKYLILSFSVILVVNLIIYFIHTFSEKKKKFDPHLEILVKEKNIDLFANEVAEKIKNHKIIFLGEQQHGDGETFLIKSKVIDILNKKYGYTHLLIEGSYFYNNQLNEKIKNKEQINNTDWTKAMYHFWGLSNETKLIRKDILNGNLDFFGFDYNFMSDDLLIDLSDYIKNYFSKYEEFSEKENEELFETLIYKNGPLVLFNYKPKRKNQDVVLNQILNLKQLILKERSQSKEDHSMILVLSNLYDFYYSRIKLKEHEQNAHRDSIMYRNVNYIVENLINKNDKVIIWSANAHLLYENTDDIYPMGKYLKEKYGNDIYSILFTSNKGHMYNIATNHKQLINKTSTYSLENTLKENNHNYFLYSLGNNKKPLKMKFLGHNNIENKWNEMMDSFIFIETMKPVTF